MDLPLHAGMRTRARPAEFVRISVSNFPALLYSHLRHGRAYQVTDRHTAVDYAHVLKELADVHFVNAKTICPRYGRIGG
jgi:hypothetical protein